MQIISRYADNAKLMIRHAFCLKSINGTTSFMKRCHASTLLAGTRLTSRRVFTEDDVRTYLSLTGDHNHIHRLEAGSAPVLPGMLIASLFPAIIGSTFPGALYAKQDLKFRKKAFLGEELLARVTVQKVSGPKISWKTECLGSDGNIIIDGEALAILPSQLLRNV